MCELWAKGSAGNDDHDTATIRTSGGSEEGGQVEASFSLRSMLERLTERHAGESIGE